MLKIIFILISGNTALHRYNGNIDIVYVYIWINAFSETSVTRGSLGIQDMGFDQLHWHLSLCGLH